MKSNLEVAKDFVLGIKSKNNNISTGQHIIGDKSYFALFSWNTAIAVKLEDADYILNSTWYSVTTEGKHKNAFIRVVPSYANVWRIPRAIPEEIIPETIDFVGRISRMRRMSIQRAEEVMNKLRYMDEVVERFGIKDPYEKLPEEVKLSKVIFERLPEKAREILLCRMMEAKLAK